MSARTVPTLVPLPLMSVPERVLDRLVITWPAGMKPPSKQCPLVSNRPRSVLSDDGKRTKEAEQLLSEIVALRLAAWIAAAGDGMPARAAPKRTVAPRVMANRRN